MIHTRLFIRLKSIKKKCTSSFASINIFFEYRGTVDSLEGSNVQIFNKLYPNH